MDVILTVWKNAPVVAFLLLLISTVSLAIFLERFVNVKKSKILPRNWKNIKLEIMNGRFENAINLLKKDKKLLSRILANILELYYKGEISKTELRQMVESESSIIYYDLGKRVGFISISVTLATLLGLIGTVWGLIEVFGAYSIMSNEGLKMLSRGIATSLNSTAMGLLVAIFTYILYWLVKERINGVYTKILRELEELLELIR
ncbi:MAG TPA: MotA/TolQ/ExbB proton channel family protein [Aquifex sp.]|uniref:MotA/TolQ/ExbB proton channel family protein n=1 Tax=Aquifex aeolicus TaxID=63363 RepID=A0A9D0YPE7_AQUAO|nr:MotA/TolQ/ExbB proton channel family protein [Aquifex sp.]HIP98087.1 MotA/TolQ/ExbB proton channel family protein [Aquifex aeolicus]